MVVDALVHSSFLMVFFRRAGNGTLHQAGRVTAEAEEEFLAVVARELRHPLAPLHSATATLRLRRGHDEISLRALATMDRQLASLSQMVDDLNDLTRFALGRAKLRPRRIELAEVLRGAVDANRAALAEAEHTLTLEEVPLGLPLDADPVRLTHAFEGLLEHAIRSTDRGGRVEMQARRDGGQVVITVRDSGAGISAAMLPRVFELDAQWDAARPHRPGGLGVGLTVVRSLIELHGGTVEARSEGLGLGSEFIVSLPPASVEAPAPALVPARAGLRVLVVDDQFDAAESLGVLLRVLGQDVRVAYDGQTALDLVQSFRPALVLLDLSMPGMDGFEVARRVRARADAVSRSPTLVALTALDREADRRNSWAAGFDSHLVKPVDVGVLRAMLYSVENEATL